MKWFVKKLFSGIISLINNVIFFFVCVFCLEYNCVYLVVKNVFLFFIVDNLILKIFDVILRLRIFYVFNFVLVSFFG